MAGLNEIFAAVCAKVGQVVNSLLSGIVVALVVRRKQGKRICADPRIYY